MMNHLDHENLIDTVKNTPLNSDPSQVFHHFVNNLLCSETLQHLTTLKTNNFDISIDLAAKIQFIKEEISAERYEVNSQRIAAKLTEHSSLGAQLEIA